MEEPSSFHLPIILMSHVPSEFFQIYPTCSWSRPVPLVFPLLASLALLSKLHTLSDAV